VSAMLAEMTADDWRGWQDYFALYGGLGPEEEWRWRGTVLSFLANPNLKERTEPLTPERIYPWLDGAKPPPSPEEEAAKAARAAKRLLWQCKIRAWKERVMLPPEEGA
jgi:hypothetical protein